MNDEFLHRLRKEPRPVFAARLQARLRRQSASPPPPRVASRTRTLLTLLFLGGTAFAVTAVAMRGLPPSFVVLYQQATAWISAERTHTSAHQARNEGFGEWLRWGATGSSSPHGSAGRGSGATSSAAPATIARSGPTSSAGSPGSSASGGGAPSGPQSGQIDAVASWSAYPYATAIADAVNSATGTTGAPIAPHINVSTRDSDVWPGPICSGSVNVPNIAFTFAPVRTVSDRPCPGNASDKPTYVRAYLLGYEAVALARSPLYGELDLTRREIFLALAKWVPDPARPGTVHENSSTAWRQVHASLGPEPIQFMGPPLSSPGGRSMIELLMEAGCNAYPWIAALQSTHPDRYARICRTVRTDGVYEEVSGSDPARYLAQPNAVGIIGLSDLDHGQTSNLIVSSLDGVKPTPRNIESGLYPGSRAFYLLVNRGQGIAPGLVLRLLNDAWMLGPDAVQPNWAIVPPSLPERQAAFTQALRP